MTLIYHTDDEVQKKTVDKVKSILDASSVKIEKEEDLGVRDLAYDIKKQSKGKYTFSIVNADPEKIVDIENKFRLENGLLKFLFVRKEN
jgi:small subunit ribosomal protein S6